MRYSWWHCNNIFTHWWSYFLSLPCICWPPAHLCDETKKGGVRNELRKCTLIFPLCVKATAHVHVRGCIAQMRSPTTVQPVQSVHLGHTHARRACKGELWSVKISLRSVPWPGIWRPGHPRYWLSSSCRAQGGWWEAAESSSTRSPWSQQSLSPTHCGRRLNAACVCSACGNAPWPNWARKNDEAQTGRPPLTNALGAFMHMFVSLAEVYSTHNYSSLRHQHLCCTGLWRQLYEKKNIICFGLWSSKTNVTLFIEGELSEPEELFLDSSSADIDFPLRLREIRAKPLLGLLKDLDKTLSLRDRHKNRNIYINC